ncbi:MAG: sucrase/ferredoxin-like family protein [Myxococcota bacterium]
MDDGFCKELCDRLGESMWGTAPTASTWILLETSGAWARNPMDSAELSPAVVSRLKLWLQNIEGSRLQLVRSSKSRAQAAGSSKGGRSFGMFVAFVDISSPRLVRLDGLTEAELLSLDLPALRYRLPPKGQLVESPIYLVCTHGKRDRCCAKWGLPVLRAFKNVASERALPTTHLGGHRFSANVVCLPEGVAYGRVEPEDVSGLFEAHESGRYHVLEKVKGQVGREALVQVADVALRNHRGWMQLSDVSFLGVMSPEVDAHDGAVHAVQLQGVDGPYRIQIRRVFQGFRIKSCGDVPSKSFMYAVERIEPAEIHRASPDANNPTGAEIE